MNVCDVTIARLRSQTSQRSWLNTTALFTNRIKSLLAANPRVFPERCKLGIDLKGSLFMLEYLAGVIGRRIGSLRHSKQTTSDWEKPQQMPDSLAFESELILRKTDWIFNSWVVSLSLSHLFYGRRPIVNLFFLPACLLSQKRCSCIQLLFPFPAKRCSRIRSY